MPETTLEQANVVALQKITDADLVQATLRQPASPVPIKTTLRPVEIKSRRMVQISRFDGRKTHVQNVAPGDLPNRISELLAVPYASLFVTLSTEDTQIQVTKKGKCMIATKRRAKSISPVLKHDRTIARALPEGAPDLFLQKIGLMTADGKIKADRQRKYQQINEFIRLVSETTDLAQLGSQGLVIVDFGCGNAYLSFALHHYLNAKVHVSCELIGVDRNPELITRNTTLAGELGAENIHFITSSIGEFVSPKPVDVVVALHACDTATDQALAQALQHQAKLIFSAPCCHHHLQVQLSKNQLDTAYAPIARDGILRERLGDIVTDSLRAMILRIAGYRVDVIEFTSPEHTAKNLLIRARKTPIENTKQLVMEYQALKRAFDVTPHLESLVPEELRATLSAGS